MKIILYDGDCSFCSSLVTFIWKRDPDAIFSFANIQSHIGQAYLQKHGITNPSPDTFYLIDGKHIYDRSDAAIHVGKELKYWKQLSLIFGYLPRWFRNWIYNRIALNRHRLPSKQTCEYPNELIRQRFLDSK